MKSVIAALLGGIVFGLGLLLSGMGNPAKVQNFLDLAGHWDPSLALVMGGAVGLALPVFAWARRQRRPLLGGPMQLPMATQIDGRLLAGSALFGIGWGLAGFCPGPALMNLATGHAEVWLFVAAMLAGMGLHALLERRRMAQAAM